MACKSRTARVICRCCINEQCTHRDVHRANQRLPDLDVLLAYTFSYVPVCLSRASQRSPAKPLRTPLDRPRWQHSRLRNPYLLKVSSVKLLRPSTATPRLCQPGECSHQASISSVPVQWHEPASVTHSRHLPSLAPRGRPVHVFPTPQARVALGTQTQLGRPLQGSRMWPHHHGPRTDQGQLCPECLLEQPVG